MDSLRNRIESIFNEFDIPWKLSIIKCWLQLINYFNIEIIKTVCNIKY